MNIILIGYRGSGKTTLGRVLANQLWKTFVDVDDVACERFDNKAIAAIWAEHGEGEWRRVEVEVTKQLLAKREYVIGLGGGTLMQAPARQAVEAASHSVRIYLKCDPAVLYARISQDHRSAATRPNLTALGGGINEIEAMLREREPVYLAVADKVFDVTHLNCEDAVRYLIKDCL